ncbi:hypothetical protein GCK72_009729 [Caenorhabditis remanei]|nr:hypothetical protein GCK72_009729 [Caenorhabditis remanei]KAF1761473.1 hypothetical protein GCK72_009729 [Caenorhabditis remanei]
MPEEIASFHAYHVGILEKANNEEHKTMTKNSAGKMKNDLYLEEPEEHEEKKKLHPIDIDQIDDSDDSTLQFSRNNKVMYTKLDISKEEAEELKNWDDAGSQTDHSDFSEGHYSDESTGERCRRETRNKKKSEKRDLRMDEITRKHNIVE